MALNMLVRNERRYDPDDPDQRECLRKAECYVDRTVDPPVIRMMEDDDDYEIVGWVWLTSYGELKSYGVNVVEGDRRYSVSYTHLTLPTKRIV